jgi:hypothetical protein
LLVLFLAALLVFRFARRHWFWYPLLAILIIIATWGAWIASQSIAISVLTMFVAVAFAWLLTLGRNRRSRATPS